MAEHLQIIEVVKNIDGFFCDKLPSNQLVPGDLFVVQNGMILPCDAILFDGEALVNEAALTGEIVPVPKYALPDA